MTPIRSAAELYAHAIAIEREAAERYAEFAERMEDEGRDDVARVFALLARLEAEHLEALQRRAAGVPLPDIAVGEHKWLDARAPETAARECLYRLMTRRYAIAMALTPSLMRTPFSSPCSAPRPLPPCARSRARWPRTSASTPHCSPRCS